VILTGRSSCQRNIFRSIDSDFAGEDRGPGRPGETSVKIVHELFGPIGFHGADALQAAFFDQSILERLKPVHATFCWLLSAQMVMPVPG
jgi:hypothetical protein